MSAAQVAERLAAGRVNRTPETPSRTLGQIVRANVFTPVNAIIGAMLAVILVASPGPDALFAGVIVTNSVIGIVQEIRARRALQRLAILSAPRARVVREGQASEIAIEDVVEDDVLELAPGDQVVVDGTVLTASGLELNEALLTGEAEPVTKRVSDAVLSGSFVSAGSGRYVATGVGGAAYAASLAEEARRYALVDSELRTGVNVVLRWLVFIIPPVALLLLWRLLLVEPGWREAVRGTVAAAVAMVPDGLVLLTSIAFLVGVIALARRRALAKELASVELLARVDVLCLDKTGTITSGEIRFSEVQLLPGASIDEVDAALGALAVADPNPNATLTAIGAAFASPEDWQMESLVPFSSTRKWAGAMFTGRGGYALGAPEMLTRPDDSSVPVAVAAHAEVGRRVVLLARAPALDVDGPLAGLEPLALVVLEDQIRPDTAEILGFFRSQGVKLKVISGDHPATVAAIARRAGVPGAEAGIDARDLPDEPDELAACVESSAVFGRVTPHQKRAMVKALQRRGHTVAMTGDGVNDVLALKDADMGIAMGSGSSATRAVAEIVLLDDQFATLPAVLAEGRRVINSVERAANLFLVGTTYAVLLSIVVALVGIEFPFLPRHLTLVRVFSIGIPGFFLALAPNSRRAVPGFIGRVLRFSIPAGIVSGAITLTVYLFARETGGTDLTESRTAATLTLLGCGLVVLARLARPLTLSRIGLVASMAGGYLVVLAVPSLRDFFALAPPPGSVWAAIVVGVAFAATVLDVGPRLVGWWGEADRAQGLPQGDTPQNCGSTDAGATRAL